MSTPHFDPARIDALVALLSPDRLTRIVDVGANPINDNPYLDLLQHGYCDVVGFEPGEAAFSKLTSTDRETYLPFAIGDGSKGALHVCQGGDFSSLLKPDQKTIDFLGRFNRPMRVQEVVEVQTHRLDDLDDVKEFDLLKIDVQGAEVAVYEGAKQHLTQAVAVISEVAAIPLYEDQPLLDAQMATLRKSGFDLHKFLFFKQVDLPSQSSVRLKKRMHSNQLLDGDAVFIKSLRTPKAVSDEKLKHLAILADSVFYSFDVAVRCIDLLVSRGAIEAEAAADYLSRLPFQRPLPTPATSEAIG
ncbi:MAG: FkbM family methyltransferase [Pseudomonadota bacterium]